MLNKIALTMRNLPLWEGVDLSKLEDQVLAPINWVKNILLGVVAAVGALVLILGIVDLIGALGSGHKDIAQIMGAVMKIVGGIILMAIGTLIIAFTS